jgi:hypothetical protein
MNLKGRSVAELAKIFAMGKCPMASRLLGPQRELSQWRVDMLTGPIPNLGGAPFHHTKQFYWSEANNRFTGCNLFFGGRVSWGAFTLDDSSYMDVVDRQGVLFFDYNQPRNSDLTRGKIADHVRTTDDFNVLIGEFYYFQGARIFGPYYFSLTRMAK